MKRTLFISAAAAVLAACGGPASDEAEHAGPIEPAGPVEVFVGHVFTGVTIIDGTGGPAMEAATLVVEGDRIACVGACEIPAGAEEIILGGRYVMPGLVDAHVHFGQTGWLDGRPDGLRSDAYPYEETMEYARANPDRWHRAYLCSGITAVYDVGGQDWTVTGEHATDTDRPDRVHVRAAGPLTTHASARNRFFEIGGAAHQPLFLPMESVEGVQANVDRLVGIGAQAVKVWYLAPAEEDRERLDALLMATGEAAREAGLPLIVHATSLREAKMALRAGAQMLVHSVEDQPVDQEFIDLLLANEAVYAPTLVVGGNWSLSVISVALGEGAPIDDPNNCVDARTRDNIAHPGRFDSPLPDAADVDQWVESRLADIREGQDRMYANLRAVHEAGGHVVVATDAGNPLTLHGPSIHNEMEAMQRAGLSAEDILVMATRRSAEAMGRADEFGTLEPGKLADLIVVNSDPRDDIRHMRQITHVMRKGELYDQDALQLFDDDAE